jgi:5-methyltetrahydropteroyltriglutamate--homocysteine methyltransferase
MLKTTVVGSYPRKNKPKDTLRKPSVDNKEALEMIRWAVEDQCQIGLDIITDGESYRENMYWFYQLRVDGVDCNEKKYKQFTLGGSTEGVDLTKAHPIVQEKGGFGIECAVVKDKVKNPRWELASKWRHAQDCATKGVIVKQTITGPHMLSRFSVNERTDLYKNDIELARAFAKCIKDEISELENVGCHHVQFDEPVLTEAPSECDWAADIINEIINSFPNLKFSLHICGGNAHRKRGYFGRYTEMLEGLKKLKVHEIHLEHCTLHYNMLDVFNDWKFDGILSFGVIDQRTDEIETIEQIHERILPVLKYFEKNKILISSECGFGHVPLDITRAKLGVLVEAAKKY